METILSNSHKYVAIVVYMARILVVDDNPDVTDVLKLILETQGYVVEVATTAQECMAMLDRNGYNLVMLDIQIPHMTGEMIARKLRESHDSKIVFVTIKNKGDVDMSLADAFIKKPFDVGMVVNTVKNLLNQDTEQNF